jgi:SAM-dependent methyltransferase
LFSSLEAVAEYATGRLLDIGCGNKPYEHFFPGVSTYTGTDIIQSSLNRVDILCEATSIPVARDQYDTVLSTQTLEHVADHEGLCKEAFRILKPGGHFIFSCPMYWPLHEEPYDFFRFTRHGLEYLMKKLSFGMVEIHPNGGKWALCGQALIHAIQGSFTDRPLLRRMINLCFAFLDDRYPDHHNTMNYVVVARKMG